MDISRRTLNRRIQEWKLKLRTPSEYVKQAIDMGRLKSRKGIKLPQNCGVNNPQWKGGKSETQCLQCKKKFLSYESKKSKFCGKECRIEATRGKPNWRRGKEYPELRGEKNPNWNGGTSRYSDRIRGSIPVREWARQVLARDNDTCRKCGSKEKVETHHIIPFKECLKNKILLLDINNGITLCHLCHTEIKGKEMHFIQLFRNLIVTKM